MISFRKLYFVKLKNNNQNFWFLVIFRKIFIPFLEYFYSTIYIDTGQDYSGVQRIQVFPHFVIFCHGMLPANALLNVTIRDKWRDKT